MWITKPLVVWGLAANEMTNAMVRTTTAPTMFSGSQKDNVLPSHASAVINFRILPGDTVESVLQHVTTTIDDERIVVAVLGNSAAEPSPVSPIDSDVFRLVARSAAEAFPGAQPAPFLVTAATDARHYAGLSDNVYRFTPMTMSADDRAGFHGMNERIGVADRIRAIVWPRRLRVPEATARKKNERSNRSFQCFLQSRVAVN